jgi:hypothetical protein
VSEPHTILHLRKVQVMETMSKNSYGLGIFLLDDSKHGLLTRDDESIRHVPCQISSIRYCMCS